LLGNSKNTPGSLSDIKLNRKAVIGQGGGKSQAFSFCGMALQKLEEEIKKGGARPGPQGTRTA